MAPITIEVDTDKEKVVITSDEKTFSFLSDDDREIDCPCCERPSAKDGAGAEIEDTNLIDDAGIKK
jgi:hypothetical protein